MADIRLPIAFTWSSLLSYSFFSTYLDTQRMLRDSGLIDVVDVATLVMLSLSSINLTQSKHEHLSAQCMAAANVTYPFEHVTNYPW